MPGMWPAARKTIGTTPDMPAPRHAKPAIAATGEEARRARPNPTAAIPPPARTIASGPKRSTNRSAEPPPGGRGHAEGGEADGRDGGGGAEVVAQVDGAPVGRCALDEQAGEGQGAEGQQPARRAHEDGVGAIHGVLVGGQEAPRPR